MEVDQQQILDFLGRHKLMSLATYGQHPWIANVYYTFDEDLNLYFLSSPTTLHCRQITKNPEVAVSIADSSQSVDSLKRGLQLYGVAKQISGMGKIRHALNLWKSSLGISKKELSYENMIRDVVNSRIYKVIPKKIKLFDQELFPVEDGQEPVLIL